MGYSQSSLIHLVGPSDCTLLGFVHGGELAARLRVGLGTWSVPGHAVGFSIALVEGKKKLFWHVGTLQLVSAARVW